MTIYRACSLAVSVAALATLPAVAPGRAQQPQMVPMEPRPSIMSGDQADVALSVSTGIPTIEVMVNGKGPYVFVVDSGAPGEAVISARLASELGLRPAAQMMIGDPSGKNPIQVPVYELERLSFGGLSFAGMRAPSLPPGMNKHDGVLGLGLFKELLLTMDYGSGRLSAARGALPAADGKHVVDYQRAPNGFVRLPVKVGDQSLLLNLDTGATKIGMALPKEKVGTLPTKGAGRVVGKARTVSQEIEMTATDLAAPVLVGSLVLPVTTVISPSPGPVGLIGSGALAGMALTIDQRNSRVRIVPSGSRAR